MKIPNRNSHRALVLGATLWLALAPLAFALDADDTPANRAAALEARAARLEADVDKICAARPPQAREACAAQLARSAAQLREQAAHLR